MQQFINWGGETPEQIAERRRFEEEMREFMINKMLMEAAQNGARSASTAIGGGSTQVEATAQSAIIVYYNEQADLYEYFTANPATLSFSEPVRISEVDSSATLNQVYMINQKGYAIVFINTDNSATVICVSANGDEIARFTTVPTTDLGTGLMDGRMFYCTDFDDQKLWVFDGTTLRLDEDIFSEGTDFALGSYNGATTLSNALIVKVEGTSPNGAYREWWSVGTESSVLLFTDEYEDNGAYINLSADFKSDHFLVEYRDLATNEIFKLSILNKTGEQVWTTDLQRGSLNINWWFYGTQDLLLIQLMQGDDVRYISFDPSASVSVSDYGFTKTPDTRHELKIQSTGPGSAYANPPANTFAVVIGENIGDGITGNMQNVSGLTVLIKFLGRQISEVEVPVEYANTYDFDVSDDALIMPVSEDGTLYQLLKVTRGGGDFIGLSNDYLIDQIAGASFNLVANGFLVEIAYGLDETSYIHMIGNSGEFSESRVLSLPGIQYNSNNATDWFDESGPLLYYVFPTSNIFAWLPDAGEWLPLGAGSTDADRYSTRTFADPEFRDGSNYLIIGSTQRLFWFTDEGTNDISDGGNDMYDGANELYASNPTQQIPYTHTQISNNDNTSEVTDPTAFAMDGEIVSGAGSGLGQASEYFTNCYPGLFVMSAINVETTYFKIDGNIGADGNGLADSGRIQLAEPGYWLFYKRVWGAGDPSINQLIIVNADDDIEIAQQIDQTTDDDLHGLDGLDRAGTNQIHYLLFALANGLQASLTDITNLANAYVEMFVNQDTSHQAFLDELNLNYETLLENVPAHVSTSDRPAVIVSRSAINPFTMSNVTLDDIRLGTNGLYIVSRIDDLIKIDHYSLTGQLVSSISTQFDQTEEIHYTADRGILMVSGDPETPFTKAIYIFNETGYARKDFVPMEGWNFTINDYAWWD